MDFDGGYSATPFEDYFIEGMTAYDGRLVAQARTGAVFSEQFVDNISLSHTPQGGGATFTFNEGFEDFPVGPVEPPEEPDPPILQGGTPFSTYENPDKGPGPQVVSDGAPTGAQPGHLWMTIASDSLTNSIAFDQTDAEADNIAARFRMKIDPTGAADGMAFAILDVDSYSDSGPFEAPLEDLIYYEEPNFPGTLAIGFDIYDGDEEADPNYIDEVDPDGCGGDPPGVCVDRRANHISVHWDGALVGKAARLDPTEFDLVNGQWNDVTVLATEVEGGMNVSVAIEDADGQTFLPFTDLFVEGASFPNGARAAFGGRTGGSVSSQRIDDVFISWTDTAGLEGDYNEDGEWNEPDLDLQASEGIAGGDLKYDLNGDGIVDFDGDRVEWLHELKKVYVGDADLNGYFDSSDFVTVFTAGKYETQELAAWAEGDWDGNGQFDSSDFVVAFVDGGYEGGLYPGNPGQVNAVPEPSGLVLILLGLAGLVARTRRRRGSSVSH